MYARDAVAAAAGARTLAEFSDGRFVLGLGVSNARLANSRGHVWEPPVEKLTSYITAIREAQISVPGPHEAEFHVAAHGPKMLENGTRRFEIELECSKNGIRLLQNGTRMLKMELESKEQK